MDKFYIKLKNEKVKPFLNKNFGVKKIEIEDAENIDYIIEKIIKTQSNVELSIEENKNNKITIFISNEMASFSSNLLNKYKLDKNTKIIII